MLTSKPNKFIIGNIFLFYQIYIFYSRQLLNWSFKYAIINSVMSMKRLIKPFVIIFLLICMAFSAEAAIVSDEYPDFEFEPDVNNTYNVSAYKGSSETVVIPESLYSREIKRFSEKALYKNNVVTSLIMHDNMTVVNKWALRKCANLENVYFSKKLVALWDYSFAQNDKLKTAFLRNTAITSLYQSVFYNDTSLSYVSLPDTLESIGTKAFENTALENIVIPESVKTIKTSAFAGMANLKKVYIPGESVSLDADVFKNSPNVTVYVVSGSTAEKYCEDNSINYVSLNKSDFPSFINGDVDNNGRINIRDAAAVQRMIAKLKSDIIGQNCDVNGDCSFDIKDASYIQKIIAHMD